MVEGKEDQIYGDRRWFDLGQWAHNATYRSCVTELYIWSLCDPINQYYLNKFNKIKEKKRKASKHHVNLDEIWSWQEQKEIKVHWVNNMAHSLSKLIIEFILWEIFF